MTAQPDAGTMLDRPWTPEDEAAFWERVEATPPAPPLRVVDPLVDPDVHPGALSVAPAGMGGFPEPQDVGTARLSAIGDIEYVEDLIRPGRIHVLAAEEGVGKSFAMTELAVRLAVAGGDFAGTFTVRYHGGVVLLSEMHADDDYRYQQDVLDALDVERSTLSGRLWRLELGTAALGRPVLTDPDWRRAFTAWARRNDVRLAVFDTGTGATQVDPWGREIQQVYRDLRVMLGEHEELAVVLLLHMKKPTGRGARRISDVLGEWGRWCDVLVLLEDDGNGRTKLTTKKRLRRHHRISALRRDGLLVEPQDLTDVKPGQKVASDAVQAAIEAEPGITRAELAEKLGVSRDTAGRYVRALSDAVRAEKGGPKEPERYYPLASHSDAATHSDAREDAPPPAPPDEAGSDAATHDPYRGVRRAASHASEALVDEDLAEAATDDDGEAA